MARIKEVTRTPFTAGGGIASAFSRDLRETSHFGVAGQVASRLPVNVPGAERFQFLVASCNFSTCTSVRLGEHHGKENTMETSSQQDIIELLFLALYQDDHLSIEEDSMLDKALKALGWEESEKTGPSVGKAFAAVREANAREETKETFLVERAARIKSAGESALALEWLGKVLGSDGLDRREELFLERTKDMLF